MILLVASALAGTWGVGVPLPRATEPTGALDVPAGEALRLTWRGEVVPTVRDAAGDPVPSWRVEEGLLVAAAGARRALVVEAPPQSRVLVYRSGEGDAVAWERWERAATAAMRAGDAVPPPPWGGARLAASLDLRAAALTDPGTTRLGFLRDTLLQRPLAGGLVDEGPERALPLGASVALSGPGVVVLRGRPPAGALRRYELRVSLDGEAGPPLPFASTGTAPLSTRLWIPPGRHHLEVRSSLDGVELSYSLAHLRPLLTGPPPRPRPGSPVDAAEHAWLYGRRAEATTAFRALLDSPGPAGELARARLLSLVEDPAELAALAALPAGTSEAGAEVQADAVLARAAELPVALVVAAALRAREPDPALLAAWLDGLDGPRPRGVALLERLAPPVPAGPSPAARALREAALATRWTSLAPVGAERAAVGLSTQAPGVPRRLVGAGESLVVVLPEAPEGRHPALRLRADGPVTYGLDGATLRSVGGELHVAVSPGAHLLRVDEGALLLLDPELERGASPPGALRYEWPAAALPATFALPDPSVAVSLRLRATRPVPLRLVFDDGRVERLDPTPDGAFPTVRAGPWAGTVRVEAAEAGGAPAGEGVRVGLALQATLPEPGLELPPPPPVEEALAQLATLSRRIDAGEVPARLERAALLGRLGLLSAARRDLAALPADGEPATRLAAAALDEAFTRRPLTASSPGPLTPAAALAAAGLAEPAPTEPAALAALARRLDAGGATVAAARLHTAAGEALLAAGDLPAAWAEAEAAGPTGAELRATLAARADWTALTRADHSAGLLAVQTAPRAEPAPALWQRAAEAMLTPPWSPAEAGALRGGGSELVRFTGSEVRVALYCRDEAGPGRPCEVPLRFDGARETVSVADGAAPTVRTLRGRPGEHELELGAPGAGWALLVRVEVDGRPLPPRYERLAVTATARTPAELVLARPTLLRVEVLEGALEVEGRRVAAGEVQVVPLLGEGPANVVLTGTGTALLATGRLRPERPAPPPVPVPPPTPVLDPDTLSRLLSQPLPPLPSLALPAPGGSVGVRGSLLHERVGATASPWTQGQLEGSFAHVGEGGWQRASTWLRGPGWGLGLRGELGASWSGGWARAELRGGTGGPDLVDAGSFGATLRARQSLGLAPRADLRLGAALRAGWFSPAPEVRVDPRAWTRWGSEHPVTLSLDAAWVGTPARDLRLELGGEAVSNTGPSLDSVAGWLEGDLLLGGQWVLSPGLALRQRFADEHRALPSLRGTAELAAARSWWLPEGRRLDARVELRVERGGPEGELAFTWWWTGGRGLQDLPPDSFLFRTARGQP